MRRAPSLLVTTMALLAVWLVVAFVADLIAVFAAPLAPAFRWLLP